MIQAVSQVIAVVVPAAILVVDMAEIVNIMIAGRPLRRTDLGPDVESQKSSFVCVVLVQVVFQIHRFFLCRN